MKVEIKSEEIAHRPIPTKTGIWDVYEQTGYVYLTGKPFPIECKLQVETGKPYKAGFYGLSDNSYSVDRFGKLSLTAKLEKLPQEEGKK